MLCRNKNIIKNVEVNFNSRKLVLNVHFLGLQFESQNRSQLLFSLLFLFFSSLQTFIDLGGSL